MPNKKTLTPLPVLFVRWYYLEAPVSVVRGTLAYAAAIAEIVPFLFLLRTLVSPWKNIADRRRIRGLDLGRIMEKLSLGLLARGVGLVVRLLTILFGLIAQILLLVTVILYLTVWMTFPVLFAIGIAYCIQFL